MKIAFLDCFSGISGDMVLGALIDGGLEPDVLRDVVGKFDFPGLDLKIERTWRSGLAGTKVDVLWDESVPQPHRGLSEIRALLDGAQLDPIVRGNADKVFYEIARAEAHVHGCGIDEVHFHEVGAIDAVVDVVGACQGFHALKVERIHVSEIRLGHGFVHAAHGKIPVPVMATFEILKGVPTYLSDTEGELVTPTGAALARVLGHRFGRGFSMTPTSVGYGFGTKERENPPNALRIVLGVQDSSGGDAVQVLETNVDDLSAQLIAHLQARLLASGALDVVVYGASMKKSRPGHVVQVLCHEGQVEVLTTILFEETLTLGVRRHLASRTLLSRKNTTAETQFGSLRVKEATLPSGRIRRIPEFDDVQALALRLGRSAHEVQRLIIEELNREQSDLV